MMNSHVIAHIDEVERAAIGEHSSRDAIVQDSWKRCIDVHGLDPARMREAFILPDTELREHQQQMEDLIHTARFGLESLHQQVAGLGYVLLLSDAEGITVDYIGDPTFDNNLRQAGLYLGANWKEEFAGTCAVGSCIATQEALIVHQTDHFDATHTSLTCTAAPIHDTNGRMAAVLDISALRSPQAKDSQLLALQMVVSYVQRIEMANLMSAFRANWIVRLSPSHEFLDVEPSCALALDSAGRIAGFTNGAQCFLADQIGVEWRDSRHLIGRSFVDFFDFDPEDLGQLTRATPANERLIAARDSSMLFAHAIAPQQLPVKAISRKPLPQPLSELTGHDPAMKNMLEKAARLVDSQISILLSGETGTGKEYLARALHAARRVSGEFVAVNCAALPENLIESELFGYAAGAFTGALSRGKKGLIQLADGGTIFLDEIGDMPLALQARLLRVLSEKEVLPIGGDKPVAVNIRVIAATHRDMISMIKAGEFREDLYYRLNGAVLTIPALREREDFDWLLDRLISMDSGADEVKRLDSKAREIFRAYHWPGNIRELVNAVDFAKAVSDSNTIGLADLPDFLSLAASNPQAQQQPEQKLSEEAINLNEALSAHRWNISATARFLGVDRTTIHRKMKRLGLVSPNKQDQ